MTPPPQKHSLPCGSGWCRSCDGLHPVPGSASFCLLIGPSAPGRGGASEPHHPISTYSAEEERRDVRLWRTVIIGEQEHRINMKVIEPYMKVISHGGADAASDCPHQKIVLTTTKG